MFGRCKLAARVWASTMVSPKLLGRGRLSALAVGLALVLLLGAASCTGSPATLALPPDFEVMTQAGVASVSIRQSLPGTTNARFMEMVKTGMERAAPGRVLGGPVDTPFPSRRIVWHADPTASRGIARLVVNAFDGAIPYAYELETVADGAPTATVASAVEAMSTRLLAAMEAHATRPRPVPAYAGVALP
jgi:hypothetical protein